MSVTIFGHVVMEIKWCNIINMKMTELDYIRHIGDVILSYKNGDFVHAREIYTTFLNKGTRFEPILGISLNLEYLLDENYTLMSKENLLKEIIEEYLKIKQRLLTGGAA